MKNATIIVLSIMLLLSFSGIVGDFYHRVMAHSIASDGMSDLMKQTAQMNATVEVIKKYHQDVKDNNYKEICADVLIIKNLFQHLNREEDVEKWENQRKISCSHEILSKGDK